MSIMENNITEAYKALKENQRALAEAEQAKIDKKTDERNKFINEYNNIIDSAYNKQLRRGKLLEGARNNALSTVIKAIYITALEANTLTDEGIALAESMVDKWIIENGGASKILSEISDNTYMLARITQIVEDAAKDEVDKIEKLEKGEDLEEEEKKSEEKSDDEAEKKEEKDEATEESKDKTEEKEDKSKSEDNEKESDDEETEDSDKDAEEEAPVEDKESETPENTNDGEEFELDNEEESSPEVGTEEPVEADPSVEENIEDEAEKTIADAPYEKITTIDGDEEQGKIFDELEKEEDVQKAVELIRQRVADAEETFIKRNAEDKKQIDELLSRISDNVKTVEDMDDQAKEEDIAKAEVAKEAAFFNKQRINNITENRPLSIFEKMTRVLSSDIVKNEAIRENYLTESGSIDMVAVVESAKVMYGFLETLNTLQLEKVNKAYLEKMISEM